MRRWLSPLRAAAPGAVLGSLAALGVPILDLGWLLIVLIVGAVVWPNLASVGGLLIAFGTGLLTTAAAGGGLTGAVPVATVIAAIGVLVLGQAVLREHEHTQM
jgi:hypothetical protein